MIQEGDKIFAIRYTNHVFEGSKRSLEKYTVKEIKEGRIFLKGGYEWSIPIDDIGDEYFFTKEVCYKNSAINNIQGALSSLDYDSRIAMLQEAIKLLRIAKKESGEE